MLTQDSLDLSLHLRSDRGFLVRGTPRIHSVQSLLIGSVLQTSLIRRVDSPNFSSLQSDQLDSLPLLRRTHLLLRYASVAYSFDSSEGSWTLQCYARSATAIPP